MNKAPTRGQRLNLNLRGTDNSTRPKKSPNLPPGINLVTVTMPLNFVSGIHDQIPEGVLRDVVGQIYFGEEISPENKTALYYEGINLDLIVVHPTRKLI